MEVTIAKETELLSYYHTFSAVTIVHALYKSAIGTKGEFLRGVPIPQTTYR